MKVRKLEEGAVIQAGDVICNKPPDVYLGGMVNPARLEWVRNMRANDILTVLAANRGQHLDSKRLICKAAEAFPERWSSYFRSSRTMASYIQTALRDIQKVHGDVLDVRQDKCMSRAKRGGMGRCRKWNEYRLRESRA